MNTRLLNLSTLSHFLQASVRPCEEHRKLMGTVVSVLLQMVSGQVSCCSTPIPSQLTLIRCQWAVLFSSTTFLTVLELFCRVLYVNSFSMGQSNFFFPKSLATPTPAIAAPSSHAPSSPTSRRCVNQLALLCPHHSVKA